MTTDEIIEHIREDITRITDFVLSLDKLENMMSKLDEYHNRRYSPEDHDTRDILSRYGIADIMRCCKAMDHDATDNSWESTFVTYGVYKFMFSNHDWATIIDNPDFKEYVKRRQDGLFVTQKQKYDFMLNSFFEEYGYFNAASQYVDLLYLMSIHIALLDERITAEEDDWLQILKKYSEDLKNKAEQDIVERGDPFEWLNNLPDEESEKKNVMKFYFDADLTSSFKLRMMIDECMQNRTPVIFAVLPTSNSFMYKIIADDDCFYVHADGYILDKNELNDGTYIARLIYVNREESRWSLYFRRYFMEDHQPPSLYAPYVLGREYKGEVNVKGGSIVAIQADSFLNKTSLPTFIAKIVDSRIVFFDPKKKYPDMNVVADYDNSFYNYMNAAIRNGQEIYGTLTSAVNSPIMRVLVCKKE